MMPLFVEDIYLQQNHEEVLEECNDDDENVDEEDDYNDDIKGDKNGENYDEIEDIDNEDDDYDFFSNEIDKCEENVESNESIWLYEINSEDYEEIEDKGCDDESSSDFGSSRIIPVQRFFAIGHDADDHDVMIMERVSPEPGM
jgi:hypothetical protein